jgi:hypothetical protein
MDHSEHCQRELDKALQEKAQCEQAGIPVTPDVENRIVAYGNLVRKYRANE